MEGGVSVTREEYKALLEREIYGSKKRTWSERRWLREKNPSTNAVYLIRRMQYYAALPGALARRRARSARGAGPDTVAVWDTSGDDQSAQWGEIMTLAVRLVAEQDIGGVEQQAAAL